MNKIKAVVFDLDDTLISEYDYIKSGYDAVALYLSNKLNINKEDVYNQLIDLFERNSKRVFNDFYINNNINYSHKDIEILIQIYRHHDPQIDFLWDVIPTFEFLKKSSIKIGIISDGYLITQKNKVKSLKLNKYVDHIILTDDLGKEFWKPHPKSFELMRERLNVEFEQMIYVGDNSKKDFYIKKTHPIFTVRIKRPEEYNQIYRNSSYRNGVREDYLIKDLLELKSILRGIE